ncbi:class I SAM-dependent methyltransferase [Bradyrhizobium sp. Arg68]|uniref:class I SAM-dependent methyltransferase n=1 Tax=Bradyrhizobium ivorense TaxID=2511166 RepID=UPI001E5CD107|nr:class I SAM-dependent methyltransferase [Bradyrhizobium ivorense]MCC8937335.1 class I SAM-dependent methyltransferase [Bradyrhizobium ivorense]
MSSPQGSGRRCLACSAVEAVADDGALWPLGWRCSACGAAVAQDGGIPMFAPSLADTVSGVDPKGFELLAKVEAGHFWFVPRSELIVGLADKFFPQARRFIEVGCGTGTVLGALARSRRWERLVGSELHPSGLAHARQRLPDGVEFVQMDARDIPAAGVFDLTGAFDVIEHIADDEGVLRGMRAATQTGGGIIIAVPQHPWLWSRADDVAYHQRRYRRGEVETKLRRNGFEVLFSTSYTSLLLPLMIASRLKGRGKEGNDDVEREFTLDPRVNGPLTAILRAEVRMTLAGWRWPAGGSRVVVGRAV